MPAQALNMSMTAAQRTAAVRAEVAQEMLGNVIAHYSAVWSQEDDKAAPDVALIAHAQAQIERVEGERRAMDEQDPAGIEALIAKYQSIVNQLYRQ